jgi:hypothetical protein
VVAGENEDVIGLLSVEEKQVLVHGIGCAAIPLFADALLGGDRRDEFAEFGVQHVPAGANMSIERMGFVLNKDGDFAEPRVETVAQGKINNTVLPAERNGRFGPVFRQGMEPLAPASCQHHRKNVIHGWDFNRTPGK